MAVPFPYRRPEEVHYVLPSFSPRPNPRSPPKSGYLFTLVLLEAHGGETHVESVIGQLTDSVINVPSVSGFTTLEQVAQAQRSFSTTAARY